MAVTQEWVRVGKVPYGRGVFARTDIPAGTTVGQVTGKIIDDAEYASTYCIDLGGSLSLEPRAPFRYLNHCCTPNSQLVMAEVQYEDGSPAPSEIYLETLKAIPAGAELTIDYAWSIDGAIPCLCGSEKCRGWVVAEEDLPKLRKSSRNTVRKSGSTAAAGSPRKKSGSPSSAARSSRKSK